MNRTVSYTVPSDQGEILIQFSLENERLCKYSWATNRHCNADYELHVLLKGKCILDVEETHCELSQGEAVIVAPGKYHKPHGCVGQIERFSMGFTLSDGPLSAALQEAVPQSYKFTPSKDLLDYCQKLIEEDICQNPMQKSAEYALVTLLAISVLRNLQIAKYIEPDKQAREELERTQIIDLFFERNYDERCGCEELAKRLHLSTRQLSRILKEHYGMGFQEKCIRSRMDRAAILLRTTDDRVQNIIGAVGYSSAAAFYKAFVEQFGVTPQKYRRASKKANGENK